MSSPDIVVLDTRRATDKEAFLSACARDLRFPAYFGHNWDGFEECLRDFADAAGPTVVVWTGAAELPEEVRTTALQIFGDTFTDGVDLLVVDDVSSGAPPFMSWAERIAVPRGGLATAADFWATLGLAMQDGVHDGPGLTLHLVEVDDFHPTVGPLLAAADLPELRRRAEEANLPVSEDDGVLTLSDPFGSYVSFTPY